MRSLSTDGVSDSLDDGNAPRTPRSRLVTNDCSICSMLFRSSRTSCDDSKGDELLVESPTSHRPLPRDLTLCDSDENGCEYGPITLHLCEVRPFIAQKSFKPSR
jgi:hypothetical protein